MVAPESHVAILFFCVRCGEEVVLLLVQKAFDHVIIDERECESVECGAAVLRCCGATVLRCYGATVLGATWVIKNRRKKGARWWNSAGPLQFRHFFFFRRFFFFSGDIKYAVVFGDKSRKSAFSAIAYGVRAYLCLLCSKMRCGMTLLRKQKWAQKCGIGRRMINAA